MVNEKFDWTVPVGDALTYFQKRGVPIDEIIEEIYDEVTKTPKFKKLNSDVGSFDQLGSNLMNFVTDVFVEKISRKGDNIEDFDSGWGFSLVQACVFYCVGKGVEGENYRNFYDFLAQSRIKLGS